MIFLTITALAILFVMLMDTRARLKKSEVVIAELIRRLPDRAARVSDAVSREAELPVAAPKPAETVVVPPPKPVVQREEQPERKAALPWANAVKSRLEPKATVAEDTPPAPEQVAVPTPTPTKTPTKVSAPAQSLASRFENLFGKMLPIWAGGLTLAIAGVLIVRYAIDAGFFATIFTPTVQIITGLLFGLGLIGGAEYAWRHEDKVRDVRVAQALSGAGIATLFAAIMVAANVYQLIGPIWAFFGLALTTAGALGLSLRFGPPSAVLGLVGGLAAPAMVGAEQPNVPLLALYLAMTIAGLAGVSRSQRWPWLALGALVGGMGWGLWMVLAGEALDSFATLSVGGFVLATAIALPLTMMKGPRTAILQSGAAIVGAVQLALLVGYGGFTLLHWGLFVLIAAAGQWLAWRERSYAIIPSVSLLLSLGLLALWPAPTPSALALIGLALLLIHAVPLVARLWEAAGRRSAAELCLMALAVPALAAWHFWAISDSLLAGAALVGAACTAAALWRGWAESSRSADQRYAGITATCAALLALALGLLLPVWMVPLAIGVAVVGLIGFGQAAKDLRIERVAAIFLGVAFLALLATNRIADEIPRLVEGAGAFDGLALLRWGGLALAALVIAVRAENARIRRVGQAATAVLAYGALAQILPLSALMLAPAIGGAAALFAARKIPLARLDAGAASLAVISLMWAALPVRVWVSGASASLGGVPMTIDPALLSGQDLTLRLLLPVLLFAGALWPLRASMTARIWKPALAIYAVLGLMAIHSFYRLGFAMVAGDDFVSTGIIQRLIWAAILIAAGVWTLRRGPAMLAQPLIVAGAAHAVYYGLLLHNPLWSAQAVGAWPVANLLIPLFLLPAYAIWTWQSLPSPHAARKERAAQIAHMLLVAGFAWASLRQLFHGNLLIEAGVTDAENILRSVLLLALALGFLMWGIRTKRHDWRIASLLLILGATMKVFLFDASGLEGLARIGSFVVLGFSLIGIGWLYSRQLGTSRDEASVNAAG